jgi:hypothetical protein
MPRADKDKERFRFLADRMAILLVIAKMRYGNDWNPFFRDSLYDDEGSLGDEIRSWPEYKAARMMIRRWVENDEKRRAERGKNVTDAADAAGTETKS